MSKEIERYTPSTSDIGDMVMRDDGFWVRHSDVASLLADVEALRAKAERLEALCKRWNKAIVPLTASGSEFIDDPERCAENIKSNQEFGEKMAAKKAIITATVDARNLIPKEY